MVLMMMMLVEDGGRTTCNQAESATITQNYLAALVQLDAAAGHLIEGLPYQSAGWPTMTTSELAVTVCEHMWTPVRDQATSSYENSIDTDTRRRRRL